MRTSNPQLTIVIPAYNEEECIKRCLDSIAAQTVAPTEVIVVDNNSTDSTVKIAKSYGFVTLVSESTQGIAYAHRRGFDTAKTDYIARIDADCILPDDWVARISEFYNYPSHKEAALVGSGTAHNTHFQKFSGILINSAFLGPRLLLGHFPAWGPNLIVPANAWARVRDKVCFEDDIFDDLDLSLHLYDSGVAIAWRPSIKVQVRIRNLRSFKKFFSYVQRWPRTLKNHDDKRWIFASVGSTVLAFVQYPIFRLMSKGEK